MGPCFVAQVWVLLDTLKLLPNILDFPIQRHRV